jgi:hypothetical protein
MSLSAEDTNDRQLDAQLEGIETRCANDVVDATWQVLQDKSWGQLADLLSLRGATEMATLLGDTIRAELRGCFADVYRLGFEEGRRVKASDEDQEPSYPVEE